jgi:pseudouridine-5'-monophosphatase
MTSHPTRQITHVIFDNDGLLLDTETIYTRVFTQIFAQWNVPFDLRFKLRLMGCSATETAALCVKTYNLPITATEFQQQATTLQMKAFQHCPLMPGASRLVRHLAERGIPIAVATSSMRKTFDLKTREHGELFNLMDAIVTGDDPAVLAAKPAPDIFLEAKKRLAPNVPASNFLVFEDAPNGVRAALAAGMHCIWVADPIHDYSLEHGDLLDHPKVTRLESLEDLNLDRWGLPLY